MPTTWRQCQRTLWADLGVCGIASDIAPEAQRMEMHCRGLFWERTQRLPTDRLPEVYATKICLFWPPCRPHTREWCARSRFVAVCCSCLHFLANANKGSQPCFCIFLWWGGILFLVVLGAGWPWFADASLTRGLSTTQNANSF